MQKRLFTLVTLIALVFAAISFSAGRTALAQSKPIVYNSNASDPVPRAFDEKLVKAWNDAHPDMQVKHSIVEHEAFKQAIRAYLVADPAPDVLTWFAGNRARFFIDKGLIADISDLWKSEGWDKAYAPGFKALATVGDKQYFVANNYYWWALYFRPSILKANGLEAPKTFDDMFKACDVLNAKGITPITIGSNQPWTTAAWFDYLDMRINGPEFHINLMLLKEKYSDERVKKVFTVWKQFFDHKCFNTDAAALKWQDAVTPLVQGKAAMYLMGAFINDTYQTAVKDANGDPKDLDFVRFPIYDAKVEIGEDAPTDGWFLSAKAGNLDGAKKFLAYLGSKEVVQMAIDDPTLSRLPVRTDVDTSKFNDAQKKGVNLIQSADYVAQFYDRDTTPPMAEVGLNVFGGFYSDYGKTDIDGMMKTLEDARARIAAEGDNGQ